MDNTFTREQLDKIDLIENAAYRAVQEVLGFPPAWDIHWIGSVAEAICNTIVENFGKTEMEIYPYTEDK